MNETSLSSSINSYFPHSKTSRVNLSVFDKSPFKIISYLHILKILAYSQNAQNILSPFLVNSATKAASFYLLKRSILSYTMIHFKMGTFHISKSGIPVSEIFSKSKSLLIWLRSKKFFQFDPSSFFSNRND